MAGGRPTEYGVELLEKANKYLFERPVDEVIPSIEGLADYLGITRTTIYDWESQEDKKEFSYIVEQVRHKQAKELVNKGLEGKFNASIAKVILTKHGYTDKQEIDHTTKGERIDNSDAVRDLTIKLNALHRGDNEELH